MNELDQALLTGEKIVFATKKHWFSPVRDSAIAVLIVLGSFLLRWLAPQGEGAIISGIGNVFELVANLALIASILWIAWNVFAYVSANFGVSNMRVLRYEGIIQRRSSETLLSAVTDVQLHMPEAPDLGPQVLGDRRRRRLRPKEARAHVVLDPDHVEALLGEEPDRLRPDQPAGTRDERDRHTAGHATG